MHLSLIICLPALAAAHTTFTNLFVDGADQGNGTCVRMPTTPQNATFPVSSITSPDMACGADGSTGVARVCPAVAGSTLTFEFRDWPDGSHPGSLDASHKGTCAVYMKKVPDATANDVAAGPGWFKIWEQTYDDNAKKWCTEHLMANNGLLSVKVPNDIQGGYYLVRPELLALQQADKTPPDPQFYVGCAQVFLTGGGTQTPKDTVSIPGYVDMNSNHAAMTFSVWKEPLDLPYPAFGPQVYQPTGTSNTTNTHGLNVLTQTVGLKPPGCVLVNANWCGIELSSYSDAAGCSNASTGCWTQAKQCYASAPPTGSANCRIWEAKCQGISDACSAGNYQGPPDAGRDLTPPEKNVTVPLPGNAGDQTATTTASAMGSLASATATPQPMGVAGGSVDECGSRNSSASCALGLCCSGHGYCGTGVDYCG